MFPRSSRSDAPTVRKPFPSPAAAVFSGSPKRPVHEETECGLPLNNGSVTLTVSARWPENTPDTPVTLELEPEGKTTVSATRWSFGPSLNDSYSFSWK